jgi:hypothetical protein
MGCIRSLLRIWGKWTLAFTLCLCWTFPSQGWAAFATKASLTVAEEYSDNIFFTKKKEHDFITNIIPTLSLFYAPTGQAVPTLNLNISPTGQIYARHPEQNNFGDNLSLTGGYTYHYSPRLNFHFSDTLRRAGQTRTSGGEGGAKESPAPPTSPPPTGGALPQPFFQGVGNYVSGGDHISNYFSAQGSYLFRPDIRFNGGYSFAYTNFIDSGGSETFHTLSFRGVYNWQQEHNLHAGYSVSIGKARDGDDLVVHNFDFGDDYFTSGLLKFQLTPTLTLAASTGLSLNTGTGGVRIANNSTVTVTKLWETATLTGGVRKGLTPSFGVSGISDTTTLYTSFNMRLTEKLTTYAGVDWSFFDTKDVSFNTLTGRMGLQYQIAPWLSSSLSYNHRRLDSGAGATRTDLLEKGTVNSNTVFLALTAHFDVWPRPGLSRTMTSPTLTPIISPPFPTPASTAPTSQP